MSKPQVLSNKKYSNTFNLLDFGCSFQAHPICHATLLPSFHGCTERMGKHLCYLIGQFQLCFALSCPMGKTSCSPITFTVCLKVSSKPKSKEILSKEGCNVSVYRNRLLSMVFFHVRVHLILQYSLFNSLYCHLLVKRCF